MYIAEELARYAADFNIDSADKATVAQAKKFFADGMACMIAGADVPPVRIACEYAQKYGGNSESSIIASNIRTDSLTAAMANGIAAHYLDYDDAADTPNAHVSAVMLPTVLAVGESLDASGKQVLEAYMTGIEVCSLLGRSTGKENFRRGWHSTSSLGVFGAAAAAGKLMALTPVQLTYALGIAASESSGIKANFGTMTKSFHAGSAAAKGIRAARLAILGYDSRPDCIENKCGYADLTIGMTDFSPTLKAIENNCSEFVDPGLIMKPYPSCKATHNGIDAALQLVREYDLRPGDIGHIEVRVQPYVMDLLRYPRPQTKLQGKFSMNYTIALAVANRAVKLSDFEGPDAFTPVIAELIEKTDMLADTGMNGDDTMLVRGDTIVTITTASGRALSRRVNYATGDPHKPMSEEARRGKLEECLSRTLRPEVVPGIIRRLEQVDGVAHIGMLTRELSSARNI